MPAFSGLRRVCRQGSKPSSLRSVTRPHPRWRHSSTQPVRQGQDCDFSAFVALRDEGLHPKLRELFERAATFPFSDVSVRSDGMLQAGPNPRSGKDGSSGIAISFPRETCPEAVERELEKRP